MACVAVCCSVQSKFERAAVCAVCCSALQCVAVFATYISSLPNGLCCSVLQRAECV